MSFVMTLPGNLYDPGGHLAPQRSFTSTSDIWLLPRASRVRTNLEPTICSYFRIPSLMVAW